MSVDMLVLVQVAESVQQLHKPALEPVLGIRLQRKVHNQHMELAVNKLLLYSHRLIPLKLKV